MSLIETVGEALPSTVEHVCGGLGPLGKGKPGCDRLPVTKCQDVDQQNFEIVPFHNSAFVLLETGSDEASGSSSMTPSARERNNARE